MVGRLASGVAHDFNHLLGLILGYAERGRRTIDTDTLRGAIEGMELAAKRARAVSQKLLSFSRHDNADPQTFDVFVDGVLATCEPASVLPLAQRYMLR